MAEVVPEGRRDLPPQGSAAVVEPLPAGRAALGICAQDPDMGTEDQRPVQRALSRYNVFVQWQAPTMSLTKLFLLDLIAVSIITVAIMSL